MVTSLVIQLVTKWALRIDISKEAGLKTIDSRGPRQLLAIFVLFQILGVYLSLMTVR